MTVDAFLTIDDIKGESQDNVYKDAIEIITWHWGMSQSGSAHSGTGSGSGRVSVRDITVVKLVDRSSPNLIKLCCTGKHFANARLILRKAGDRPIDYVKLVLSDGLVSAVSYSGGRGDERLIEQVSFNFASFKYEYAPQTADGRAAAVVPAQWNMARNSES